MLRLCQSRKSDVTPVKSGPLVEMVVTGFGRKSLIFENNLTDNR